MFIDYETRSKVDLGKHGLPRYATDKSTHIQCMGFARATDPHNIGIWIPWNHLDIGTPVHAHNAAFEKYISKYVLGADIQIHNWRCTAAQARAAGLPGKLENACEFAKLPIKKDTEGHKLMLKMCKPQRNGTYIDDEESHKRLQAYCKQDVAAEIGLHEFLPPLDEHEQTIWEMDREINEFGVPIDTDLCNGAIQILEQVKERINEEVPTLTEGFITAPTQVQRIKKWCVDKGVPAHDLSADTVAWLIASKDVPGDVKRVLELRQMSAPAAVKKFQSILDRVSPDGLLREQYMYYGTGTGRWSGAGGVQMQNFKRGQVSQYILDAISSGDLNVLQAVTNDPIGVMQHAVRQAVCAPPGKKLVIADFAAIEARVARWYAGSPSIQMFRDFDRGIAPDPYKVEAGKLYKIPASQVTSEQRQVGKAIVALGAQYGCGPATLQSMAFNIYKIEMDIERAKTIIYGFRKAEPELVKAWKGMQYAAAQVICGNKSIAKYRGIEFNTYKSVMTMKLLSGRKLFFWYPKLEEGDNISVQTGVGTRETIWGGVLFNYAIQAMSRDIMADAMLRCNPEYQVVSHTHDEIILLVDSDQANDAKEFLTAAMATNCPWLGDCPIKGPAWVAQRWEKE